MNCVVLAIGKELCMLLVLVSRCDQILNGCFVVNIDVVFVNWIWLCTKCVR